MINTIHGEMDESELIKKEGSFSNAIECTTWVEYRVIGCDTIVHRSVHVTLKEPVTSNSAIGN